MSENLKSVPLERIHIKAGAKMVPFGGWNMPVQYQSGILNEHNHTRQHVSIFDCSHMGQFRIKGANASADLDKLLPRLAGNQPIGSCRYNFLLTPKGTVNDDIIVYRLANDEYYIVVNGATIHKDAELVKKHLSTGTSFSDESGSTVKLDIQGPKSAEHLVDLGLSTELLPRYFKFSNVSINNINCLISRTGYTGELGYELYVHKEYGEELWHYLTQKDILKPAGLGARDTLRLEVGYPLYGHELDEETTPIEAGFSKILNINHDFTGKELLLESPSKKLIGIVFDSRRAVRHDEVLFLEENTEIGIVTSGSFSPSLRCSIALGFTTRFDIGTGDKLYVSLGNKRISGTIVDLPFYKDGTVRNKL